MCIFMYRAWVQCICDVLHSIPIILRLPVVINKQSFGSLSIQSCMYSGTDSVYQTSDGVIFIDVWQYIQIVL